MAKLLSYLYPITKKIVSPISGPLEVTWYCGKKYLDTKNANYSYGSLQAIFKFGLEHLKLDNTRNTLLLGLGGGSVIQTLREDFNYQNRITAVDIDPVVIAIAKEEFGIEENQQLQIICQDALDFMNQNHALFDLILVDLFVDLEVPEIFLGLPFWQSVVKASAPNAQLIFNAAIQKHQKVKVKNVFHFLQNHFYKVELHQRVNGTNTLIIAQAL